jgi:hypothetical protein
MPRLTNNVRRTKQRGKSSRRDHPVHDGKRDECYERRSKTETRTRPAERKSGPAFKRRHSRSVVSRDEQACKGGGLSKGDKKNEIWPAFDQQPTSNEQLRKDWAGRGQKRGAPATTAVRPKERRKRKSSTQTAASATGRGETVIRRREQAPLTNLVFCGEWLGVD